MRKFIYQYILFTVVLFALLYWELSPVARVVNEVQTQMLLYILGLLLPDGQIDGIDIIINPQYHVIITQACNGMIPYLVLASAILAYNRPLLTRLKWLSIGYILFFIVNVVRLLIVTYFVTISPSYFWISHDIFGNALLMASGLYIFYLYGRKVTPNSY